MAKNFDCEEKEIDKVRDKEEEGLTKQEAPIVDDGEDLSSMSRISINDAAAIDKVPDVPIPKVEEENKIVTRRGKTLLCR